MAEIEESSLEKWWFWGNQVVTWWGRSPSPSAMTSAWRCGADDVFSRIDSVAAVPFWPFPPVLYRKEWWILDWKSCQKQVWNTREQRALAGMSNKNDDFWLFFQWFSIAKWCFSQWKCFDFEGMSAPRRENLKRYLGAILHSKWWILHLECFKMMIKND